MGNTKPSRPSKKQAGAAFEPTTEQRIRVAVLATCGVPQPIICAEIINPETDAAIDAKTLRQHFRSELDEGKGLALGTVAGNLFRIAMGDSKGAVTAAIFILKTQAGWREPVAEVEDLHEAAAELQRIAAAARATAAD